MRVFVGVRPSVEAAAALAEIADDWPIPGRVVPVENWHVTLRFIGGMDAVAVDRLLAELDQADLGGAFDLVLGGPGAFPKPSKATVLWLGFARGGDRLVELAETVDGAVAGIGLGHEERPFVPHLTLARIRPPEDVRPFLDAIDVPPIRMTVDRVTVFSSITASAGPVYEVVDHVEI